MTTMLSPGTGFSCKWPRTTVEVIQAPPTNPCFLLVKPFPNIQNCPGCLILKKGNLVLGSKDYSWWVLRWCYLTQLLLTLLPSEAWWCEVSEIIHPARPNYSWKVGSCPIPKPCACQIIPAQLALLKTEHIGKSWTRHHRQGTPMFPGTFRE